MNPGSIAFVRTEEFSNDDVGMVLGPPTISTTLPKILQSIPESTVIIKMDIQVIIMFLTMS